MRNRRFGLVPFTLLVLLLSGLAQTPDSVPTRRLRIAVLDFDYSAVQANSTAIFGTKVDLGESISNLLAADLEKDGTYSVVERKDLDRVLTEQKFSGADRADVKAAAKIGQQLGVDAVLVCSLTQFGRENNYGAAAGAYGRQRRMGGYSGDRTAKAIVAMTARLVRSDSSEILAKVEGKGESKRESTSLVGGWRGSGDGTVDFASSDLQQTTIGEATKQAVDGLASAIIGASGNVGKKFQAP
jgi:curli biogenesis system outer membrane secretion channel CsgG